MIGRLVQDREYWKAAGAWIAGIFGGLTFIVGLGAWHEAFINAPLQTVVVFLLPVAVGLGLATIKQLYCGSMSHAEFDERIGMSVSDGSIFTGWSER